MEVGSLKIRVVRKDIRNIHLAVYPPNGIIRLASPRNVSQDTLRLFVVSKIGWIRKQQRKFQRQDREGKKEYAQRESHYYLGRRYLLKTIEKKARPVISTSNKYIVIQVRPKTSPKKKRQLLDQWYRGQMKQVVEPLIEKWEQRIKVEASAWSIRKMRTKWGSCNTESKRILLNPELVKKPVECIEFVIAHELVHLLERKHNERFLSHMDRLMKNWKTVRGKLNQLPL